MPILAILALAELRALQTRTEALTVPLLAHRLFARASAGGC